MTTSELRDLIDILFKIVRDPALDSCVIKHEQGMVRIEIEVGVENEKDT